MEKNETVRLIATGTDQYGNVITGLAFAWGSLGGAIDESGMFTAGSEAGQYEVTAAASLDSVVSGVAIVEISPRLSFLRSLGSDFSAEGRLNRPTDIAFDNSGNVYVVDQRNHRIQVFSPEGDFVRQMGGARHGKRAI